MNTPPGGARPGEALPAQAAELLAFWREAGPSRWFKKDAQFDDIFRSRFLGDHEAAARGELDAWARSPEGALALLLLLDQFPRNAFRGSARMFATDAKGLALAKEALDQGFDMAVDAALRNFFYVPFMHSEELADQNRAVELTRPLDKEAHHFAVLHRDIIARFGRFPHRNPILGRQTTPEEQQFLDEGGFAG
jgi:uncharacterized protein (DUF924 family)